MRHREEIWRFAVGRGGRGERDTKVTECGGKFDAIAFQLDGLRNRVETEKHL